MITKQQVAEKTKQLAGVLLGGGELNIKNISVTNSYYLDAVKGSDEFDRLMRKAALYYDIKLELYKLFELEALKIADEYALDILEMEQENEIRLN